MFCIFQVLNKYLLAEVILEQSLSKDFTLLNHRHRWGTNIPGKSQL